jgi:hypothetical protein
MFIYRKKDADLNKFASWAVGFMTSSLLLRPLNLLLCLTSIGKIRLHD